MKMLHGKYEVVCACMQNPREYVFANDRRHIVQEYIVSPLLVDMLKFDLRVYVVVTSIDPLEVFTLSNITVTLCFI